MNKKPRVFQQNNCTCKYYELNPKKGFGAFDIGETTDLKELNMDELLFDAYKTGEKIFNNIKELIKETNIDGNIIEQIEKLDLDNLVNKNIEPLKEWCEKYGFPIPPSSNKNSRIPYLSISTDDILNFSKNLMIFYFVYSFHLNLVFLYNDKIEYYLDKNEITALGDYIEKFKVKINNINILGSFFIKNFQKLDVTTFVEESEKQIEIKNYKEDRQKYIEDFKIQYLKSVNDISYNFKNSIISVIDIENKTTDVSSEDIFHLIWHTFMNYVVLDTKPSKICECIFCGCELIQTGSKKPTRCDEHKNTGRQTEKDIKKKNIIKQILLFCKNYNINDKFIDIITELENVLKKGNSEGFRNLNLKTIEKYNNIINSYAKENNLVTMEKSNNKK